ncbi:MAG TPA: tRNA pseudouridine(55) synthase TruB [Candidatus Cloacimonadota bacterium]|jgi:tRNA pseudouridine55 synthase|nr:tRNA pseudouridine(55) synthase TruB [Candidatus Cloacimonadota bacterium]HQB41008.1 tRNA pseudouridine(55) synthase TruB [Candidatus Cloacimonadota bacterium]
MKSGFILIDKPEGISSFDVIRKLRKVSGIKKMGHAGTLDPFATGLMIIALNNATRLLRFFDTSQKTYIAGLYFGSQTDTGDITGEVTKRDNIIPNINIKTIEKQVKLIKSQTPSKYSAIKINGKKAYELARKDIDFEMKERKISVLAFHIHTYKYPELYYECTVSSGTYIRTLSEQIADLLNTIAYTKTLRRTAIDDISVNQAVALDELNEENWHEHLLSYDSLFPEFQHFSIAKKDQHLYFNGVRLEKSRFNLLKRTQKPESFIFDEDSQCIGLSIAQDNQLIPMVIFNDKK